MYLRMVGSKPNAYLEVRLEVCGPERGVLLVVAPLQAEARLWLVMVD